MSKISIILGFVALLSAFLCNLNIAFPAKDLQNGGINAFLLIAEKDSDDRTALFKMAETYPVKGLLHSCLKGSEGCACEGEFKSSIADLLTWARTDNGMSIGFMYQAPPIAAVKQSLEPTNAKQSIADNGGKSSVLENIESPEFNPTGLFESLLNQAKTSGGEWLHSFETLLQNLSGLRNKKTLFTASTSESRLPRALEIFQRHFSIDDTLLIVLSACSSTDNMLPFVAAGPGSEYLKEIKGFGDVAPAIKQALEFYKTKGSFSTQKVMDSNVAKSRYPRQDEAAAATTLNPEGDASKSSTTEEVLKTVEANKSEVITTKKVEESVVAYTRKAETSPPTISETSPKLETTSSKPKEIVTKPYSTATSKKPTLRAKSGSKMRPRSEEEEADSSVAPDSSDSSSGESIHTLFFLGTVVTFVTLCMSY